MKTRELRAPLEDALADVQAFPDRRGVPIARVGVRNVRLPITVLDRSRRPQSTVATARLSVDLSHQLRGTHMSRFMEILQEADAALSAETLPGLLARIRARLDAGAAEAAFAFPYFLSRRAPITGAEGLVSFDCRLEGTEEGVTVEACVPVTTLCPCSKEISARGAHNQRGIVTVRARSRGPLWIEDLVEVVEESASCRLYPILKRPDEKWVTETAYDNPRFVEDIVREATIRLRAVESIEWFRVRVVNMESIHEHDAFAEVEERWSDANGTAPSSSDLAPSVLRDGDGAAR